MKRRGFLLNSAVLVLLIPMLLLLATYEDVSSQIIRAQSERTQVERTYNVVTFLDLDFQKALEISGKRAVVAVVDYVAVTGRFISPNYMVNNTIADLILTGNSSSITGYDLSRTIEDQTIAVWLSNVTTLLQNQGYTLSSTSDILSSLELEVAPLDAFTVVIKARIPQVTIADASGKVVYTGPVPSSGGYAYSTVDIRGLEDPVFSAMTGGRYQRSVRACEYSFPELAPPFKVLNGNGSSSSDHYIGLLSQVPEAGKILFGSTYVDGADAYVLEEGDPNVTTRPIIVNTTRNGLSVDPGRVFNEGDMGVLVFGNTSLGSLGWCSSLNYRFNLTVTNGMGVDLSDYQIPILISSSKLANGSLVDFLFQHAGNDGNSDIFKNGASIAIYDQDCNPVPFWIEYWDPTNEKALIWIRDSLTNGESKTYSLYFGSGAPTKGNGDDVFIFFDDFEDGTWDDKWASVERTPLISSGELYFDGGNNVEAIRTATDIGYFGSYAVRFRMKGDKNQDWDSGIGVYDSGGYMLLFTDDYSGSGDGLAVHRPWWSYYTLGDSGRADVQTYHVYEAIMVEGGSYYDAAFRDALDENGNVLTRRNDDTYSRTYVQPLRYLYLVTDSDNSNRRPYYDYIFIRKYPQSNGISLEDSSYFSGISLSTGSVEQIPVSSNGAVLPSRAYDIQPLIDCLLDQRYFGITDGWSFFERLEGSDQNHDAYVALAHAMQDEMNYKYGDEYYPIGLVSFMIPHANYDNKLLSLMLTLGFPVTDVSSADYYFLDYYAGSGNKVTGYKVWGISYGTYSLGNLDEVPFYLDEDTALALLGEQGANDLLKR
ncbi:DUF2341 domain-containing protein [Palaeococcus ferrophilus]|uniref:DUF2341 domain-containing protein n=1 Tax=Palaeococcus ferrophilus TaxID=83868 RepID=UPI00064F468B|nr:DUF2341 domain-containing protein [Palaeococcus ferrophilus]